MKILEKLKKEAELFTDKQGVEYITVRVGIRKDTYRIKSGEFCKYLQGEYYKETKKPLKAQTRDEIIGVLECEARFEGHTEEVFTRVAKTKEGIEIDLANDCGHCILITKMGWRLSLPKSKFYRPSGMLALPEPSKGDFEEIWDALNISDKQERKLVIGYLIGVLNQQGPFPLLILQGAQGSGKSTTMSFLRSLVDPCDITKCKMPKSDKDILISTQNNWVLSYDNLSGLRADLSDTLCGLATGTAITTRELYTNYGEAKVKACNPVILNGIDDIATQSDLASRSITLQLKTIENRRTVSELESIIKANHSNFLGYLCAGVCFALRNKGTKINQELPRMADFAQWVVDASKGLGFDGDEFVTLFKENQKASYRDSIGDDPVLQAIKSLMADEEVWKGSATELFDALSYQSIGSYFNYANSPAHLAKKLNRMQEQFKAEGFVITKDRVAGKRSITITKFEEDNQKVESDINDSEEGFVWLDDSRLE